MEYEMRGEGEDVLFDRSTNPSLKEEDQQAIRKQSSVGREDYPARDRKAQKGEVIPEEDDQLS